MTGRTIDHFFSLKHRFSSLCQFQSILRRKLIKAWGLTSYNALNLPYGTGHRSHKKISLHLHRCEFTQEVVKKHLSHFSSWLVLWPIGGFLRLLIILGPSWLHIQIRNVLPWILLHKRISITTIPTACFIVFCHTSKHAVFVEKGERILAIVVTEI